jgi:hypothetical protein
MNNKFEVEEEQKIQDQCTFDFMDQILFEDKKNLGDEYFCFPERRWLIIFKT